MKKIINWIWNKILTLLKYIPKIELLIVLLGIILGCIFGLKIGVYSFFILFGLFFIYLLGRQLYEYITKTGFYGKN